MNSDTPSPNKQAKSACMCKTYPLLLLASTTIAAIFCFMYVTKPTNPAAIESPVPPIKSPTATRNPPAEKPEPEAKLMPDANKLPGDEPATFSQPIPAQP